MKQLILYTLALALVTACGKKSSGNTENISDNIKASEAEHDKAFAVKDTLQYYLRQSEKLPSQLYHDIFAHELSDIDKAYVKEIKKPVQSFIPVVVAFKTVESDREKEYIDLHLFKGDGTLKKSVSLDYEIPYDLFRQEHRFVNDSILEIQKFQGLSYDNDSTVKTILTIRIDEKKIFDTMEVQLDTIY